MRRPAKNVPCAWHDGRRLFAGGNMADNLNDSRHFGLSAPIVVTLPDGSRREFPAPVTGAEIAAAIGPGLAKAAIAIAGRRQRRATSRRAIDHDAKVAIVTRDTPEGLEILRHDAAHVMAEAVKELYPETQVTFGPATETGFYYDFARDRAVHARRSRTDRGAHARDRRARRADHPRGMGARRARSPSSPASARTTRPNGSTRSRRTRRSASIARAISSISASARICPRPASSARRSS